MTTFMQLKEGDPIFFVEIEKFKIVSGKKVQRATIKKIFKESNAAVYNVGIELDNGEKFRVNWNNEAQKIDKNGFALGALTELNCFIYATTEKGCKDALVTVAKTNYDTVYKYASKANANLIRLTTLQVDSALLELSKVPASVTTEAVYV